MSNKALLLSIKPKYVSLIANGEKKYELRRKCPKVTTGDLALVYESSPTMSLVGAFIIGKILQKPPQTLWRQVGVESGVSHKEFMEYFEDCEIASALEVAQYWPLENRVSLEQLRTLNNIEPPQSYRYLCEEKTGKLLTHTFNETQVA